VFAADVASDGIENSLETIAPRDLALFLQFQEKEDCVGFYFFERQPASCQLSVWKEMHV
jgi:hypothetical protein